MFRIYAYGTASTNSATYIIGGINGDENVSTIAEFNNNIWRAIGSLNEPKHSTSAIPYNGEFIIVGGMHDSR